MRTSDALMGLGAFLAAGLPWLLLSSGRDATSLAVASAGYLVSGSIAAAAVVLVREWRRERRGP